MRPLAVSLERRLSGDVQFFLELRLDEFGALRERHVLFVACDEYVRSGGGGEDTVGEHGVQQPAGNTHSRFNSFSYSHNSVQLHRMCKKN